MNVTSLITVVYENKSNWTLGENKPNQTRSEAEIPTGELLGILKPGTNLKILYKDYVQNWCYLLDYTNHS